MWWFVAVFIISLVIATAMMPKAESAKPAGLDDITVPTADEGGPIPVLFGTRVLEGPNCVWDGDLRSVAIRK